MTTDISGGDSPRKTEFDLLEQEVRRERQADHRWFAANPRRTIHIRRAFPAEARRSALLSANPLPPDAKRFTLVRRLDARDTMFYGTFAAPRGFMIPITEAGALRAWDRLCAEGATLYGAPIDQVVAAAEAVLKEAA